MSNKEEIYKVWIENRNDERKLTKLKKCEGSVINNELLVWFSKNWGKTCQFLSQYYRKRLNKLLKFTD